MRITYEIQDGSLVFLADDAAREYLRELEGYQARALFVLEEVQGNGLEEIQPEEIGALTSAPIFALDSVRDDQGALTDAGRVFWFPDYAVRDEWEELTTTGRVAFQAAP